MDDSWFNPASLFGFTAEEDTAKDNRVSMSEARGTEAVTRIRKPPPTLELSEDNSTPAAIKQKPKRPPPVHEGRRRSRDDVVRISREESFKTKGSKPKRAIRIGSKDSTTSQAEIQPSYSPTGAPPTGVFQRKSPSSRKENDSPPSPLSYQPAGEQPLTPTTRGKLRVRTMSTTSQQHPPPSPLATAATSIRESFSRMTRAISAKEGPVSNSLNGGGGGFERANSLDVDSKKKKQAPPRQRNFPFGGESSSSSSHSSSLTTDEQQRYYSSLPRTKNDMAKTQGNADQIRQIVEARKQQQEEFFRSMSRNREGDSTSLMRNHSVTTKASENFNTKIPNTSSLVNGGNFAGGAGSIPSVQVTEDTWIHMSRPEITRK
jgi:hypothetical protein